MKQWAREEKAKRAAIEKAGDDEEMKEAAKLAYTEYRKQQLEFELSEYQQWAEAYPTDMSLQYEMGRRHFLLGQFDEAVTAFQAARNDPKFRVDAAILLGRSFLENKFLDEAEDTLTTLVRDYPQRDGPKFMDMSYWRGRVLETKGTLEEAVKAYSQVYMLDSAYLDVAGRIKRLREEIKRRAAGENPSQG
jgi:tetratricopeptide (TPR) repeat protein